MALVHGSRKAFTGISSTRRELVGGSWSRPSYLRSTGRALGSVGAVRLPSKVTRRTSTVVARGSVKEEVREALEFYIHEIRSVYPADKTATLKLASLPPEAKPLQWGSSFVFDNEVREGPGADSALLGRERGWGVVTDQNSEEGLQLLSKISFTEGKFAGSTITFSGNVGGKTMPYELLILGGTGHFRGARGYVLAQNAPRDGLRFIFHWKVVLC